MSLEPTLRLFLRRSTDSTMRLEAADGSLVVQSRSYHQLRVDLKILLAAMPGRPPRVKIYIGSPQRRLFPVRGDSGSYPAVPPS